MSQLEHEIEIFQSDAALDAAARFFVEALAREGELAVCLTGGDDARLLYERIASHRLDHVPWERTHWFWSDERFVAVEHKENNQAMARRSLLALGRAPEAMIHPIPTSECGTPINAAVNYDRTLRGWRAETRRAKRPLFDLVLHGLGPDGHTASLFPGRPADLAEATRLAIAVATPDIEPKLPRISMTLAALNDSAAGLALVLGKDKQTAIRQLRAGEDLPAARIRSRGRMRWIVAEDAGAETV